MTPSLPRPFERVTAEEVGTRPVGSVTDMTPAERNAIMSALGALPGADLHQFFLSHGLASAYENNQNRGYGKGKKLAEAIAAAERRDGDDNVLRSAIAHFNLGNLMGSATAPGFSQLMADLRDRGDWDAVVKELSDAASDVHSNPAAAITESRAAVESACKHVCDENGVQYTDKDDLQNLYKKAARCRQQLPSQQADPGVTQMLQGFVTVVNGLAALRNSHSNAHGRGKQAPVTPDSYGVAALNAAVMVVRLLTEN